MKIRFWKAWFRVTRKIVVFTGKWNVINHSNYSPLANKIWNWALKKNEYAWAKYMDLWSPCNFSRVEQLLEIRKILS